MKSIILAPYDTFDISTFMIHGDLVHIGHFGGMFDDDGDILTSIEEQTVQTFRNLERALGEINLSLRNLLKVTVILSDVSDFQGMHNAWKEVFSSNYPVRTTITSDFVDEHCLIQIDGVAGIE
jgi:2-iminobutanoate/2-iminopropanoate deaminase